MGTIHNIFMRVSAKYLFPVAVSVIEATPHITEGLFSTAAVYLFFFGHMVC
jgi:hypothetical protein